MAFTDIVSRDNRFKEAYYILMDLDFSKKECSVFCVKEEDFESAMSLRVSRSLVLLVPCAYGK